MTAVTVIAIDGPSGSGKSTVSRGVGAALGWAVLDTGAMYRAVTLAALDAGVDLDDEAATAKIAGEVTVEAGGERVLLDGRDVTDAVRGPEATAAVSTVAAHPSVRQALVARQREWIERRGEGVVEGRDIGTVVFPDAALKVFLTASNEERARRRHRDEAAAERDRAVGEIESDMARRDMHDSEREASPLRAAADAVIVDTTAKPVGEVVDDIVRRFRAGGPG
jgi:CMP/dCMP kinase